MSRTQGDDNKNSYDIPEGYLYTKDHEWAIKKNDESNHVLIGITDFAAKMLHDIVYVTLPAAGQELSKHTVLGQVESVKTVSDIYTPIAGKVVKANERLTKEPEIVSASPYKDGWMLELEAKDYENDAKELLSASEYKKFLGELGDQD
jgi:glycine cleavage system H protein